MVKRYLNELKQNESRKIVMEDVNVEEGKIDAEEEEREKETSKIA